MLKEYLEIFLNPVVAVLVAIVSGLLTKNTNRSSVARERLEKVYHPLFMKIEPFLYKEIDKEFRDEFIDFFNVLKEEYSLYIYPSLRYFAEYIEKRPNMSEEDFKEQWFLICDYISRDYDKLCRRADMPVRSLAYRINKRQYKKKSSILIASLGLIFPVVILFTLLFAFIYPEIVWFSYIMLAAYILYDYMT